MSQKTVDCVQGIAQAASGMFDGALDENGEPVKIGLKREEGSPLLDSRRIDGAKFRVNGTTLICSYHSEINIREIYSTKLEEELERIMADVIKYLKKEYKKVTGHALSLKDLGEVDAMVQKTSNVRCFVTASKRYKIGNMEGVEDIGEPSKEKLEKSFKDFLNSGGWDKGKRPPNEKIKSGKA